MIFAAAIPALFAASVGLFLAAYSDIELTNTGVKSARRTIFTRLRLPVLAVATIIALIVIVVTGAVVAGLSVGAVVYGLPQLFDNRRSVKDELAQVDAIAALVARMAQGVGGGSGLAQTVMDASIHPPEVLEDEVVRLRSSLQTGEFATAMASFAEDLGTPHASKLAANLIAAEQEHATGIQRRLTRIAQIAEDSASISRKVRAERSRQAFQVKAITIVLAMVVAGILLTSPSVVSVFSGNLAGELKFAAISTLALSGWFISERLNQNVALEQFSLRQSSSK